MVDERIEVINFYPHVLQSLSPLLDMLAHEAFCCRSLEHRNQAFIQQKLGDHILLFDVLAFTEILSSVNRLERQA